MLERTQSLQFHHVAKEEAGAWQKNIGCKKDETVPFRGGGGGGKHICYNLLVEGKKEHIFRVICPSLKSYCTSKSHYQFMVRGCPQQYWSNS